MKNDFIKKEIVNVITIKKKYLLNKTTNEHYELISVRNGFDNFTLKTLNKINEEHSSKSFTNPWYSPKLYHSFMKQINNKMLLWCKINQPVEFGRDGQTVVEQCINLVKRNNNRKTNETIPEWIKQRRELSKTLMVKNFAHSLHNNTIPQRKCRKRKKKFKNQCNVIKKRKIDPEMNHNAIQEWNRGPNLNSDIKFKCMVDSVLMRYKIQMSDLISSLKEEFPFVNNSWFNQQYHDSTKYTDKTSIIYQELQKMLETKFQPNTTKTKQYSKKIKQKRKKKKKKTKK